MTARSVTGTSMESLEDAIKNGLDQADIGNHAAAEVTTIRLDVGGVRGGIEYRVELEITD